jgi:hypothetical protein
VLILKPYKISAVAVFDNHSNSCHMNLDELMKLLEAFDGALETYISIHGTGG